jgi:hypothetical protein
VVEARDHLAGTNSPEQIDEAQRLTSAARQKKSSITKRIC